MKFASFPAGTVNGPSLHDGYVFDRARLQEMAERINALAVVSTEPGLIPVVIDNPLLGNRNVLLRPPKLDGSSGGNPSCLFVTREFVDSIIKPLCKSK